MKKKKQIENQHTFLDNETENEIKYFNLKHFLAKKYPEILDEYEDENKYEDENGVIVYG